MYSKYYTENTFSAKKVINVSEFNPQIDDGSTTYTYIGSATSNRSLTCNDDSITDPNQDITCYDEVTIKNDGDKTVKIEFDNLYGSGYSYALYSGNGDEKLYNTSGNVIADNSFSLSPDESKTVIVKASFYNYKVTNSYTTSHNGTNYTVPYDAIYNSDSDNENYIQYTIRAYEN